MSIDGIAIFDFDGTLTRHDTFITFAMFAVGRRKFLLSFLKSVPWLVMWKLGVVTNGEAKQRLFSYLYKGMPQAEFAELGRRFASEVDKDRNLRTAAMLRRHIDMRHKVYVVSASVREWIEPWARANGISRVISTGAEVDSDGRLTGRFSSPNCHGREKLVRAESEISELGHVESWSYGDSSSDRYILEACTHGINIKKIEK